MAASSLDRLDEGDRIGVMVDAYTPFLVKHVKCLHLLNYLPFMRDHAARIRKLDRSGDHVGASELFLQCLKESREPGRFASFRDALVEAKYEHVARVLDGGDMERNHTEHCKLIEVFAEPIIDKMDPIVMLRQLRHHELITDSEEDEIRNVHREHSRYDAAMTLLNCVHRRKLGWYDTFMSTMLEVYPHLVQLVDPYFKEKKERQRAAESDLDSQTGDEDSFTVNDLSRDLIHDADDTAPSQNSSTDDVTSSPARQHDVLEQDYGGVPKCDVTNCVHCAIISSTVTQLQSQISDLKHELHLLKQALKHQISRPVSP